MCMCIESVRKQSKAIFCTYFPFQIYKPLKITIIYAVLSTYLRKNITLLRLPLHFFPLPMAAYRINGHDYVILYFDNGCLILRKILGKFKRCAREN